MDETGTTSGLAASSELSFVSRPISDNSAELSEAARSEVAHVKAVRAWNIVRDKGLEEVARRRRPGILTNTIVVKEESRRSSQESMPRGDIAEPEPVISLAKSAWKRVKKVCLAEVRRRRSSVDAADVEKLQEIAEEQEARRTEEQEAKRASASSIKRSQSKESLSASSMKRSQSKESLKGRDSTMAILNAKNRERDSMVSQSGGKNRTSFARSFGTGARKSTGKKASIKQTPMVQRMKTWEAKVDRTRNYRSSRVRRTLYSIAKQFLEDSFDAFSDDGHHSIKDVFQAIAVGARQVILMGRVCDMAMALVVEMRIRRNMSNLTRTLCTGDETDWKVFVEELVKVKQEVDQAIKIHMDMVDLAVAQAQINIIVQLVQVQNLAQTKFAARTDALNVVLDACSSGSKSFNLEKALNVLAAAKEEVVTIKQCGGDLQHAISVLGRCICTDMEGDDSFDVESPEVTARDAETLMIVPEKELKVLMNGFQVKGPEDIETINQCTKVLSSLGGNKEEIKSILNAIRRHAWRACVEDTMRMINEQFEDALIGLQSTIEISEPILMATIPSSQKAALDIKQQKHRETVRQSICPLNYGNIKDTFQRQKIKKVTKQELDARRSILAEARKAEVMKQKMLLRKPSEFGKAWLSDVRKKIEDVNNVRLSTITDPQALETHLQSPFFIHDPTLRSSMGIELNEETPDTARRRVSLQESRRASTSSGGSTPGSAEQHPSTPLANQKATDRLLRGSVDRLERRTSLVRPSLEKIAALRSSFATVKERCALAGIHYEKQVSIAELPGSDRCTNHGSNSNSDHESDVSDAPSVAPSAYTMAESSHWSARAESEAASSSGLGGSDSSGERMREVCSGNVLAKSTGPDANGFEEDSDYTPAVLVDGEPMVDSPLKSAQRELWRAIHKLYGGIEQAEAALTHGCNDMHISLQTLHEDLQQVSWTQPISNAAVCVIFQSLGAQCSGAHMQVTPKEFRRISPHTVVPDDEIYAVDIGSSESLFNMVCVRDALLASVTGAEKLIVRVRLAGMSFVTAADRESAISSTHETTLQSALSDCCQALQAEMNTDFVATVMLPSGLRIFMELVTSPNVPLACRLIAAFIVSDAIACQGGSAYKSQMRSQQHADLLKNAGDCRPPADFDALLAAEVWRPLLNVIDPDGLHPPPPLDSLLVTQFLALLRQAHIATVAIGPRGPSLVAAVCRSLKQLHASPSSAEELLKELRGLEMLEKCHETRMSELGCGSAGELHSMAAALGGCRFLREQLAKLHLVPGGSQSAFAVQGDKMLRQWRASRKKLLLRHAVLRQQPPACRKYDKLMQIMLECQAAGFREVGFPRQDQTVPVTPRTLLKSLSQRTSPQHSQHESHLESHLEGHLESQQEFQQQFQLEEASDMDPIFLPGSMELELMQRLQNKCELEKFQQRAKSYDFSRPTRTPISESLRATHVWLSTRGPSFVPLEMPPISPSKSPRTLRLAPLPLLSERLSRPRTVGAVSGSARSGRLKQDSEFSSHFLAAPISPAARAQTAGGASRAPISQSARAQTAGGFPRYRLARPTTRA